MRPIHVVRLDKRRPALILTRESALGSMTRITVAPITSTVKGLGSEVPLGTANGLDHDCAASCDNIVTIEASDVGRPIGYLLDSQEPALSAAIHAAFDLS